MTPALQQLLAAAASLRWRGGVGRGATIRCSAVKCSELTQCAVCDSECGEASAKLLETLHEGDLKLHLLLNLLSSTP